MKLMYKYLFLILTLTSCSDNLLEPSEFCDDWPVQMCTKLDTCGIRAYDECVAIFEDGLPNCATLTRDNVCGDDGAYFWSGHNAMLCMESTPDYSCDLLSFGFLPIDCKAICVKK